MNNELKDIIKDLANNDYTSFKNYLNSKFSTVTSANKTYIDKTCVDMNYKYITQGRYDVLARMIQVLEQSAELKFGEDVDYAIFIMDELLPNRLGVELWAYKKLNPNEVENSKDKKMVDVGNTVEFKGQDSYYKGVVVALFKKLNGAVRCIVEDDRGLLLIKDPSKAKVLKEEK